MTPTGFLRSFWMSIAGWNQEFLKGRFAGVWGLVLACGVVQPVLGGLYVGAGVGLEDVDTRYEQRGDVDLFPSLSLSNLIYSDRQDSADSPYTLGAFVGYQLELQRQGAWIAVQWDAELRGGTIEGKLSADGLKSDGTKVPDLVVEDWSFQAQSDRVLSAKVGTHISLLGVFDFAFYVLAGKREVTFEFERDFSICVESLNCTSDDQRRTATESRNPTFEQYVGGIGIEKRFGKTAIQMELRTNREGTTEWEGDHQDLRVPQQLSRRSVDFSFRIAQYF